MSLPSLSAPRPRPPHLHERRLPVALLDVDEGSRFQKDSHCGQEVLLKRKCKLPPQTPHKTLSHIHSASPRSVGTVVPRCGQGHGHTQSGQQR